MEDYCFVCCIGVILGQWKIKWKTTVLSVILGLFWDNGKSNGRLLFCLFYWGYSGTMENKIEDYCFVCFIGVILV